MVRMLGTWVSTLRAAGGVTLLGLTLCLPATGHAQSDEQRAAARALATDGSKAFSEGRWQDAVDLFTRAESLQHAPPHLLFLARSQERLGRLVRAREAYLKITKETLPGSAPQAFRDAQASAEQELRTLEPRIASLTISVEGGEGATDLTVMVDGAPMPAALVGVPRPIDPGEHRIEAVAAGFRGEPAAVKLLDGERKDVVLRLSKDPNAAAPVATPLTTVPAPAPTEAAPAPAETSAGSGQGMRIGSYVAFGVGALGLGAGTYFLIDSRAKRSDADAKEEECRARGPCLAGDPLAKETASLDDDARSALTLSIVGFAVGGVGVATGTALLLMSSSSETQTSGFSIRPVIGLGTAGVVGRF
jgi:hypothetical protein